MYRKGKDMEKKEEYRAGKWDVAGLSFAIQYLSGQQKGRQAEGNRIHFCLFPKMASRDYNK